MRAVILYPFALAAFPVLSLWVANSDRFPLTVVVNPLLLSLSGTALLAFGLAVVLGDRYKASLLTGLVVFLFWTFGHAAQALFDLTGAAFFQGGWFAVVWLGLLGLAAWPILRTRRSLEAVGQVLNFAAACLLVIPLVQIGMAAPGRFYPNPDAPAGLPPELARAAQGIRPNIYYIIPDAYARADVLEEVFGFDNREFIAALKQRGFTVADRARTNYGQTDLSLASSLNMASLSDLLPQGSQERSDRAMLAGLIAASRTFAWLRSLGYRIVSFATGFNNTELDSADVYLAPKSGLSEFDTGLVRTTPLGAIQALINPPPPLDWRTDADLQKRLKTASRHPRDRIYFDQHRERLRYTLDRLPKTADLPAPIFVLAHLIAPHPPFVLGPHGQPLTPETIYCHDEARDLMRHSHMTPDSYRQGYRDQLTYLNTRLLQVIDALLAATGPEPVIIIQADHGSGFLLNQDSLQDTDSLERFSIFAAARFPGGGAPGFAADISPVNIFRLVFRKVFGVGLDRLPDRSFYSTKNRPYRFTEVTDQLTRAPTGPDLLAVHGVGQGCYWAVGTGGNIGYFDGRVWWRHPDVTREDLHAIWALGPKRLWVAGKAGVVASFDGRTWSMMATSNQQNLAGLWASAADDLWAVGEQGSLLHFDGHAWRAHEAPSHQNLLAIWGSSATDVHAVGADGLVLRFDGTSWSRPQSPTARDLHAVAGSSPDSVWAVGDGGVALRWDGHAWTAHETGTKSSLLSVCAPAVDDVWAVGRGGVTLHYDGQAWRQVHGRTVHDLYAIWCNSPEGAMAVGAQQTVITR